MTLKAPKNRAVNPRLTSPMKKKETRGCVSRSAWHTDALISQDRKSGKFSRRDRRESQLLTILRDSYSRYFSRRRVHAVSLSFSLSRAQTVSPSSSSPPQISHSNLKPQTRPPRYHVETVLTGSLSRACACAQQSQVYILDVDISSSKKYGMKHVERNNFKIFLRHE